MDDLISEFITETSESISTLDLELVKLEQNPGDETILGNIFRLMHTIKGTCGFLGLPRLESIAHASENVLGKIRDKKLPVSGQAISLVLESLDCIKMIVAHLSQHGGEPEGNDKPLADRLNQLADGGAPPAVHAPEAVHAPAAAAVSEVHHETPAAPAIKLVDTAHMAAPATTPAPPPAAAAAAHAAPSADPQAQSIRVSIDVLENLMQMVGELVLTRNQLLQIARTRDDKTFLTPLQQLSHITTELQEGVMKTRMQPIGNAWSKFPRLIRDLSLELGKKIELRMLGAETELDRQLLEVIKDPLTHMVRNSCDHGLERPADRLAAKKSETGTVTLRAYHEGGHIIMMIGDDGRGLNIERIKQKALENGITTPDELEQLSQQQIMQFIFRAGFSTAEKVTSVSGRGVGMDVVRTNIEKIGGTIELNSELGKGSTFHIKIPLTLAIVSVLLVESAGERFALPQINVQELVRTAPGSEYHIETINGAPVLRLRGKLMPLVLLREALQISDRTENLQTGERFIVVCKVGASSFGVIVDRIFDTEEIVVKPVSQLIKQIPLYSGNTILGDGSVIMILDPNGLLRCAGAQEMTAEREETEQKQAAAKEKLVKILVFNTGAGAPKGVPLELVSRLEEIDASKIELSSGHPVIQYRDDLMRLVRLDGAAMPTAGSHEAIVFTYDGKALGLMAEQIVDIVETPFTVKMSSKKPGVLGGMVVQGKTTDIIDVAHLLREVMDAGVPETLQTATTKKPKLLYVEDSVFFRNLTVPYLTEAGYRVTTEDNGLKALARLEKESFDFIVTDIEMAGMDGFAFAEACQHLPKVKHVPIFAFSSTRSQELLARAKSVGMRDYILKTERIRLLEAMADSAPMQMEAA